jgi:hypothetical protein
VTHNTDDVCVLHWVHAFNLLFHMADDACIGQNLQVACLLDNIIVNLCMLHITGRHSVAIIHAAAVPDVPAAVVVFSLHTLLLFGWFA